MKTFASLLLVIAATQLGCKRADSGAAKEQPGPKTAIPAKQVAVDTRSVLDLARELAVVEKGDPFDADEGFAKIIESYAGKRYQWQLFLVPTLCRVNQCNALPLPNGGRDHGVVAGWMPRLELDSRARDKLIAACADVAECPFTVEATLSELTASTENFTKVSLTDVRLIAAAELR